MTDDKPSAGQPSRQSGGWFPDPWEVSSYRWWNGNGWTGNVSPQNCSTPPDRGQGRLTKRNRWAFGITIGLLIALGTLSVIGLYLYDTKWQPKIDDRELARIGPPFPEGRAEGAPYTVSGGVVCIDDCPLEEGQEYVVHGALGALAAQAEAQLQRKGYQVTSPLSCFEDGPPGLRSGHYLLQMPVVGRNGKFTATVTFKLQRRQPIVPMPSDAVGGYSP